MHASTKKTRCRAVGMVTTPTALLSILLGPVNVRQLVRKVAQFIIMIINVMTLQIGATQHCLKQKVGRVLVLKLVQNSMAVHSMQMVIMVYPVTTTVFLLINGHQMKNVVDQPYVIQRQQNQPVVNILLITYSVFLLHHWQIIVQHWNITIQQAMIYQCCLDFVLMKRNTTQ